MGLQPDDVRLADSMAKLAAYPEDATLDARQMLEVIRPNVSIIERAVRGNLVIPDFEGFREEIQDIFEATAANETGHVANYIPQLAHVPAHHFGVALCTIDGQRTSIGDTEVDFSVQSCTKPINYCIALEEYGEEAFHRTVGREPSGRGFNELTLNKDHKPHNQVADSPLDRWGNSPLDDALRGGHTEVARILREHGAQPGTAVVVPPPASSTAPQLPS